MRAGAIRLSWWRAKQHARIAVAGLGVLIALATTAAVGFAGGASPGDRGSAGLGPAVHGGDSLDVTVQTVSEVDLFEGVESATGLSFHARVSGLRRVDGCWLTESREIARSLLRGKNVRLTVKRGGGAGSDRIMVDVRLPDGSDYASTVVHEGVVRADLTAREELAPDESSARQERVGLWAAGCATDQPSATPSVQPSSSTQDTSTVPPSAPTTTTVEAPPAPVPPSSEPPATSTSSEPPADDRVGRPCLIEGMRTTSPKGNELVCARNAKNQLRWRRVE